MCISILLLLADAFADDPGPALVAPASPVTPGTSITFTLTSPPGQHIWVDGCDPVELERQEGAAWVPGGVVACVVPKPASSVDGQLSLVVPRPAPGTYRAAVAYGAGCVEGRPFVLAACGKLGVVRSEAVTIP